ncbi:MAG: hypothetical protein IPG64_26065 [Haliea sp.]|nr:hypothetical protein [Haliea sp.]
MELAVQALAGRGQQPDFASKQMICQLFNAATKQYARSFSPQSTYSFLHPLTSQHRMQQSTRTFSARWN